MNLQVALTAIFAAISSCAFIDAQPMAGASTKGQVASTKCTITSGACAMDGSSNYVDAALEYDATTGLFRGTMTTNQCSNNKWGRYDGGAVVNNNGHSASCVKQTFPAPGFDAGPTAAPLRGIVGYSIKGGVDIYGPFDAGFKAGQACTGDVGTCTAGSDVTACKAKLMYECGSNFKTTVLLDSCGGHAKPYHYHNDLVCDYDATAPGHSPLIGMMLDGHGLYGHYENDKTVPTDLDACNGHYGDVQETTVDGVTYPAAQNVYHYHTTEEAPFTVGCFGPVTSLEECKKLYPTCNVGFETMVTTLGTYENYDLDCPCFQMGDAKYNHVTANGTSASSSESTANDLPDASASSAMGSMFALNVLVLAVASVFPL